MEKINENDLGIFQNQDKVAENLKKSANALGLHIDDATIDKLAEGTPQEIYVAKNNCKMCYGRGTIDFARNKVGDTHNHSEPIKTRDWRKENIVKAHCKCVRIRLV